MRRLRMKRRTPRIGSGFSRATSGRGRGALGILTGGTTLNLDALPVGGGNTFNTTLYTALNVPAMAGGTAYQDPVVTMTRVVKVSSSVYPTSGAAFWKHEYSEGPNSISGEISPGMHTVCIDGNGSWFVNVHRSGAGTSNPRPAPGQSGQLSFSNVPGQYHICYIRIGTQLRRYNTITMAYEDTGLFPLNSQPSWSSGISGWLQHDMNDGWFVWSQNNGILRAWNAITGQAVNRTFSVVDNDIYLDLNGDYVMVPTSGTVPTMWRLSTNSTPTFTLPTNFEIGHVPSLRGYFLSVDANTGAGSERHNLIPSSTLSPLSTVGTTLNGYIGQSHRSTWVQADNLTQRWQISTLEPSSNPGSVASSVGDLAIGFYPIDGSSWQRLLCHHYARNWNGGGDFYWKGQPRCGSSPDGKAYIFDSNMNIPAGRGDVFVAFAPVI